MRPRFLICNDDGIDAPGIYALWDAVKDLGDAIIVAPAINHSSTGASSTLYREMYAERTQWDKGVEAWKIFGTPVDCVKVALGKLLSAPPTLLISGINNGGNHGKNVLYSGTIAAAIHGKFHGIPSIAFSQMGKDDSLEHPDYEGAKLYIPRIINHFLTHSMPEHTVMSVNFPHQENGLYQGIKLAKQGGSYWNQSVEEIPSEEGRRIFKHTAIWTHHEESEENDTHLLQQGYVTVTPLRIHHLTDEAFYQLHADKHLTGVKSLFGDSP